MAKNPEYNISFVGSTVGAVAVGANATASGSLGAEKPKGKRLSLSVELKGATRDFAIKRLRALADGLAEGKMPAPYANTNAEGSVAWNCTEE